MHPRHKMIAAGGGEDFGPPVTVNHIDDGRLSSIGGNQYSKQISLSSKPVDRFFVCTVGVSRSSGNITSGHEMSLGGIASIENTAWQKVYVPFETGSDIKRAAQAFIFKIPANVANPTLILQAFTNYNYVAFSFWEVENVYNPYITIGTARQSGAIGRNGINLDTKKDGAVFASHIVRLNGYTSTTFTNVTKDANFTFNGGDGTCGFAAGHALTTSKSLLLSASPNTDDHALAIYFSIR